MKTMVALAAALLCTSCHPRSPRSDVDEALDRAFEMFKQSQYEPLLEELDRIQLIAPSNYLVYETRAWAMHQMGGGEKGEPAILSNLNAAIQLAPLGAAQSYHLRGVLYDRQGNVDAAIQDYSKAIELMPTNPYTYYSYIERGLLYGMQSNHLAAIYDAKRAIELSPDRYRPYLVLSTAYQELGDREEAVKWLTVAERLAPTNPVVMELKEELGVE